MCGSAAWMHHDHPVEVAEGEWDPIGHPEWQAAQNRVLKNRVTLCSIVGSFSNTASGTIVTLVDGHDALIG
jgi:hypothetical protein